MAKIRVHSLTPSGYSGVRELNFNALPVNLWGADTETRQTFHWLSLLLGYILGSNSTGVKINCISTHTYFHIELTNENYCCEWALITNLRNILHHCYMHGIPVCFTINCYRLHTHFLCCSHHSACNFSSVCDKNLPYVVTSCLKGRSTVSNF